MSWEFVVVNQAYPQLTSSDRQKILKTSRKVGARTRAQRQKVANRVNRLQYPDFLLSNESEAEDERFGRSARLLRAPRSKDLWAQAPFSVLLQPELSNKLLQRAAYAVVNRDPRRWIKISRMLDSELIPVMPKLFGKTSYLDSAVICVVQRVHVCFAEPGTRVDKIPNAYGVAIHGLSAALKKTSPSHQDLLHLWYATMLLTFFELLDHSADRSWVVHAQGATRVLDQMDPLKLQSEMSKDLLVAQIEVTVLDATFSADPPSFLQSPEWQRALKSVIIDESVAGPRSELALTLWSISVGVAGLFRDVGEMLSNPSAAARSNLVRRGRTILRRYQLWHELRAQKHIELMDEENSQQMFALMVRVYAYQALTERCMVALCPCESGEARANSAASKVLTLLTLLSASPVMNLHLRVAERIVQSIYVTRPAWLESITLRGRVTRPLLHEWYEQLGREVLE